MITYVLSCDFAAVSLDNGADPDPRRLVSLLLRSQGYKPWKDMEAELYKGRDGYLLIARPRVPSSKQRGALSLRLRRS